MRKVMTMCLAVLVAATLLAVAPAGARGLAVGDAMPEFSLEKFGGGTVDNSTIKGKATMFLLFNTSCSICRQEIADAREVQEKAKSFDLMLVAIDMNWEKRLPGYVESYGLGGMDIAVDPGFTLGRMVGVNSTPAMVLVDKEGKVKALQNGYDGNKAGLMKAAK